MSTFAIISLIMSVIMTGAGIYAQHRANQQNIEQNNLNREDTQEFNAEEAEKARQANINQYNLLYSPQARVQQYKEAGLSPALMYSGGGAASVGGTTQMASAGMAGTPTINPIIPQSGLLDLFQQQAETEKTKAETKETNQGIEVMKQQIKESDTKIKQMEAETKNTEVSTMNLKLQNELLKIQKNIQEKTVEEQIEIIQKSKELIEKNIEEAEEKINALEIENSKKGEFLNAEIKKMNAETIKLAKETVLVTAQTLIADAQNLLIEEQTKLTNKQKEELEQKIKILTVQANKIQNAPWTAESSGWIDKLINITIDGIHGLEEWGEKNNYSFTGKGYDYGEKIKNKSKNWIEMEMRDPNHLIH